MGDKRRHVHQPYQGQHQLYQGHQQPYQPYYQWQHQPYQVQWQWQRQQQQYRLQEEYDGQGQEQSYQGQRHQQLYRLQQEYDEQSRKLHDLWQQLHRLSECTSTLNNVANENKTMPLYAPPCDPSSSTLNNVANENTTMPLYAPPCDPSSSKRVTNDFKRLKNSEENFTPNPGTTEYQNESMQEEEVRDNYYEAELRSDFVSPNEIDITLNDIGALEETKKLIHELVILPIRRPELFKGGLLKPCKGILLFGPPGTGKTMIAKAVAKECGANFVNVSLSSIFGTWMGESERNVKALFTLAAKVAPTVIFVDEIDSLLGRRTSHDYDTAYRKVKNEFMSLWDGLRTKAGKQILVLGATNRPFDLDEAIIRRFERRIMVDLPCLNSRESILKKLLDKENVESMNFKELAVLTEGYTGSDLKNLCTTAAYQPLREFLEQERVACMDDNQISREEPLLRPLNMDDMKLASKQIAASFSADGSIMLELKKWNNLYGEGGSRMK